MSDENPYAPPTAADGHTPAESDLRRELRAFVGTRSEDYLARWAPLIEGREGRTGFSLGAFVFGVLYFLYRKMYLYALLWCVGQVVLVGLLVGLTLSGVPELLNHALAFAFSLWVGFKTHAWFYAHARRKIEAAKAEGLTGPALLEALAQRGGTNLWLPLLVGLVSLAAVVGVGVFLVSAVSR